jgi:hypothetical protein
MVMRETGMLNEPDLVWVAIQEATQEHRDAELSQIAVSLYGQLGEARAEIDRLRASLQSRFRVMAASPTHKRSLPHPPGSARSA